MDCSPRLKPCQTLKQNGIPCAIWLEDALAHYGVRTVVFDVYIVVTDTTTAAEILAQNGWVPAPDRPKDHFNFVHNSPTLQHARLVRPGSNDETPRTYLLAARDCDFTVDQLVQCSENGFYPPLSLLLDTLIGSYLNVSESWFERQLRVQVAYMYGGVDQIKNKAFAEQLRLQHRQFHLDCLAGMAYGTLPFVAHERQIRDAILRGEHEIKDCSVEFSPETAHLFG